MELFWLVVDPGIELVIPDHGETEPQSVSVLTLKLHPSGWLHDPMKLVLELYLLTVLQSPYLPSAI